MACSRRGLAAAALELGIRLSVFVFLQDRQRPLRWSSPLMVLLARCWRSAAAGRFVGRAAAIGSPKLTVLSMIAGCARLRHSWRRPARPSDDGLLEAQSAGSHWCARHSCIGDEAFASVPADA